MPQIDHITRQLTNLPCRDLLISDVDIIEEVTIRIETKFMRSNGTYVDLYIDVSAKERRDSDIIILSDFGTTWDYSADANEPSARSSLEYIAESYGLRLDGTMLSIACTIGDILPSVLKLAQACVVMSDPGFLERTPIGQGAWERVLVSAERALVPAEKALVPAGRGWISAVSPGSSTWTTVVETLSQSRMAFDQYVSIPLRESYDVQVDILIKTRSHNAALMIVEHSPYEKVTMRRADHAFAIHADLREAKWRGERLSVVDEVDSYKVENSDSFLRLGRISRLISTADLQADLGLGN